MFTGHVYPLKITPLQCWKSGMLWQFSRIRLLRFWVSKWQYKVINSKHSRRREQTFWDYLLCLPLIILQYFFHTWAKWGSSIYFLVVTNMITLLIDTSPVGVHCSGNKRNTFKKAVPRALQLDSYFTGWVLYYHKSRVLLHYEKKFKMLRDHSEISMHLLEAGLAISDKVLWSTHTWRNDCNKNWSQLPLARWARWGGSAVFLEQS